MKEYLHYYDIVYTKDKAVFDRAFTADEYCVLDKLYESKQDAQIAAEVIAELCEDAERIIISYNIIETDSEDKNYRKYLTCEVVEDFIKNDDGEWE